MVLELTGEETIAQKRNKKKIVECYELGILFDLSVAFFRRSLSLSLFLWLFKIDPRTKTI